MSSHLAIKKREKKKGGVLLEILRALSIHYLKRRSRKEETIEKNERFLTPSKIRRQQKLHNKKKLLSVNNKEREK